MIIEQKKNKYWDKAWSLVQGCSPLSAACLNCWCAAEADMRQHHPNQKIREQYEGLTYLKNGIPTFNAVVRIREDRLDIPLKIKKPTVFAVWSDLFHWSVPAKFITEAFERMEYCNQHTFIVLTKRPERIGPVLFGQEGDWYMGGGDYMPNVYLGTTVENQEMADKRIPQLIEGAGNFKKILSVEPMLGPIDILRHLPVFASKEGTSGYVKSISQVICGGETGRNARLMDLRAAHQIKEHCEIAGIPFFFKGWGEWIESPDNGEIKMVRVGAKKAGRLMSGKEYNDLVWRT